MAQQITENLKQTLLAVKKAFKDNDEEAISKFEALAGLPPKMNHVLLEAYEKLGDTPLETPSLEIKSEDFKDNDEFVLALSAKVTAETGISDKDYSIADYTGFMMKCFNKVNGFFYLNGDAKTTPRTENARLPSLTDGMEIKKLLNEKTEKLNAIQQFDPDTDDIEEYTANIDAIVKESQDKMLKLALKVSGINRKGLTEWEKSLLINSMISYAIKGMEQATIQSGFGRSL